MKPFIVREEYFGGSFIRRENLTFGFLNKWQMKLLKDASGKSLEYAIDQVPYEIDSISLDKFVKNNLDFFSKKSVNYELRPNNGLEMPRGMLKSPLRLYFEITRRCNLSCRNCFSSSGRPYDDEMSDEEVKQVLSELRKFDVLETRITGGEPTQRPGWQGIVQHAKDLGMAVSMNTNGIYNDIRVRDQILELGVDQVIISLDGNKEAHESLRGKGNYDRTLDVIKYMSERANNVRINTILKEESIPFIPKMVEMANAYGTEMCFILLRPVGRGAELFDVIPPVEVLYRAVEQINELREKHSNMKIFSSYDVIQANAVKPAPDLDLTGCSASLRGVGISSQGRVECCGFLAELTDEYRPGNVREYDYSLAEMWRNSPEIQAFRQLNLDTNTRCISCDEYEKKCFGTCATMEVYRKLNPTGRDPYCLL